MKENVIKMVKVKDHRGVTMRPNDESNMKNSDHLKLKCYF